MTVWTIKIAANHSPSKPWHHIYKRIAGSDVSIGPTGDSIVTILESLSDVLENGDIVITPDYDPKVNFATGLFHPKVKK